MILVINLKTYVGQAPFSVIPAFRDRMYNDTIVTDQYNFNNAGELTEKDKKKLINFTDPYGMARTAGKGYGSAEGKGGRNSMILLNNDNNKKEINSNTVSNAISDAATQVIGGTGLGLLKKVMITLIKLMEEIYILMEDLLKILKTYDC